MSVQKIKNLINSIPQSLKGRMTEGLTTALELIDPTEIQTKDQAIQALQKLRSSGLPPIDLGRMNNILNNPLANMGLNFLGINKQDFKNGLQSISQLDNSSATAKTLPLLQGIDQLK